MNGESGWLIDYQVGRGAREEGRTLKTSRFVPARACLMILIFDE
jgi:hypothetical protein